MKCSLVRNIRRVFAKEMLVEIQKNKLSDAGKTCIFSIIESILKYLKIDNKEDYETN